MTVYLILQNEHNTKKVMLLNHNKWCISGVHRVRGLCNGGKIFNKLNKMN